jgi:uncharacterized membrane protein
MAPLIFLIVSFGIFYAVNKFLLKDRFSLSFCGRAAMSVMLIVTGISHFTNPEQMIAMMPDELPAKLEIVYFTGVCELLAIVGLLIPLTSRLTSILLIVFFIAVLPANIAGSLKQVPFGGMEYGPLYLLFRIPLQLFFIWWVYYFGIRKNQIISNHP